MNQAKAPPRAHVYIGSGYVHTERYVEYVGSTYFLYALHMLLGGTFVDCSEIECI